MHCLTHTKGIPTIKFRFLEKEKENHTNRGKKENRRQKDDMKPPYHKNLGHFACQTCTLLPKLWTFPRRKADQEKGGERWMDEDTRGGECFVGLKGLKKLTASP